MDLLQGWEPRDLTYDGVRHPTHRKGTGPGVILMPEVPGLTPQVMGFAEEVVAAGYTVVLAQIIGPRGTTRLRPGPVVSAIVKGCVSKEFTTLHAGRRSAVTDWLRALARDLHAELGGPGVGALGMCFTGGFALAMMLDDAVVAPVLCQPSVPFAVTPRLSADLGLSPADLDVVKQRVAEGCAVLGLRYTGDKLVGTRFETLTRELGDGFIRVEFPGRQHSTVTTHRQQAGVDAVLDFFAARLHSA